MHNQNKNKYGAKKVLIDGLWFDSTKEGKRYMELKLLERAGDIKALRLQPKFPLVCGTEPVKIRSDGFPNGRQAHYKADFSYERDGETIVEDVKGMDTPISRLKRAFVEAQYSIRVEIL